MTVPDPPEVMLLMEHLESSPVAAIETKKEAARDRVLAHVLQNAQSGWPESCNDEEMKPFLSKRNELSTQQEFRPPSPWSSILKELHATHPGASCMKSLGHMFVWWPGFDQQVEKIVHGCDLCQCSRAAHAAAPFHRWVWPWAHLHCDYAGPFLGHKFLVVMYVHFKWLKVFPMLSTTTTATVEKLRVLFAQFGLPETLQAMGPIL